MKYPEARNLIFGYYLKEKQLNNIDLEIKRLKRCIPFENDAASLYIMEQIDKEEIKRNKLQEEINNIRVQIEDLLKIFL